MTSYIEINTIRIKPNEIKRLNSGKWLNDNIVAIFLKEFVNQMGNSRLVAMEPMFYKRIVRIKKGVTVGRWSLPSLESTSIILIPVNTGNHWILYVFVNDFKETPWVSERIENVDLPALLIYDSLKTKATVVHANVTSQLENYFSVHLKVQIKSSIFMNAEQQSNFNDCGIFLLNNAKFILTGITTPRMGRKDLYDNLKQMASTADLQKFPEFMGKQLKSMLRVSSGKKACPMPTELTKKKVRECTVSINKLGDTQENVGESTVSTKELGDSIIDTIGASLGQEKPIVQMASYLRHEGDQSICNENNRGNLNEGSPIPKVSLGEDESSSMEIEAHVFQELTKKLAEDANFLKFPECNEMPLNPETDKDLQAVSLLWESETQTKHHETNKDNQVAVELNGVNLGDLTNNDALNMNRTEDTFPPPKVPKISVEPRPLNLAPTGIKDGEISDELKFIFQILQDPELDSYKKINLPQTTVTLPQGECTYDDIIGEIRSSDPDEGTWSILKWTPQLVRNSDLNSADISKKLYEKKLITAPVNGMPRFTAVINKEYDPNGLIPGAQNVTVSGWNCEICKHFSTDIKLGEMHLRTNHKMNLLSGSLHQCPRCMIPQVTAELLTAHMDSCFKCLCSEEPFVTHESYLEHVVQCTYCKSCQRKFNSMNVYLKHSRTCRVCKCGRKFDTVKLFETHKKCCRTCACGKIFSGIQEYNKHKKQCFFCFCGRDFSQKTKYTNHKKVCILSFLQPIFLPINQ